MKKIKFGEFIQNVNKKATEPVYLRLMIFIIVVVYLFCVIKDNKNSIKQKLMEINNLRNNINIPVDIKSKQDLEDFVIKGRNIEFGDINKTTEKQKQTKQIENILDVKNYGSESSKKELKPDKYNFKDVEKELNIKNPNTIGYKLNQVDLSYKRRLKNKQVNYKQKVKKGDLLYVSILTKNENITKFENESKISENKQEKPVKTMLFIDSTVPLSKLFIGKKVGSTLKLSIDDMISVLPKEQQQQYKQDTKQFKQDASNSINVDLKTVEKYTNDSKIYMIYKILDVVPVSLVKKLKLINNGK